MTTDNEEESMNSVEDYDARIEAMVKVMLDEMFAKVEREINRETVLRCVVQQIMEDLLRDENRNRQRKFGSGDVAQRKAYSSCKNIQQQIRAGHSIQESGNKSEQDRIEDIHRIRSTKSLVVPSTYFSEFTTEVTSFRRTSSMPSDIDVCSQHTIKHDLASEIATEAKQTHSNSYIRKMVSKQNVAKSNPGYEMVKILSTPYGEVREYTNGDKDGDEVGRVIVESINILKTRVQADRDDKDNREKNDGLEDKCDKKSGFLSRVRGFFRRMCCCCCSTTD